MQRLWQYIKEIAVILGSKSGYLFSFTWKTRPTTPMITRQVIHLATACIYARFSSDRQREESIDAQVRACNEYAQAHGLVVARVYEDKAVSGKNDRRAEFQRLMRAAERKEFDTILVHKYNRFARRMTDHVIYEDRLNGYGVQLIAVAEDFGQGKEAVIMKSLMRALSEYYIMDLADEVKKGHKETALKGLHNGGVAPFGYDVVDQAYIINELEAGFVRKIFTAAVNREGFTAVIAEMAAAGIKGKRGKPVKYTQIYEMLRNVKYTGTYLYSPQQEANRVDRRAKPNAIRIENALPLIIDKALFEEVQRIMNARKQTGKKAGYLCSGLVYCECGSKMHGLKSTQRGHTYTYFYCAARCGLPMVRMDRVDEAATKYLQELLSPVNQQKIAGALRQYHSSESSRVVGFNSAIKKQVSTKQKQYDTLMDNLAATALPPEVIADIGARMKALKSEMDALRTTPPPHDYTADQITVWLESLKAAADEKAIHLLIERIDIKNKTDINIESTLKSVLGKSGCPRRI